ncbi:MAG: hypothetical protein WBL80_04725 [Erysipelotrichaceae bacterium]
MRKGKIRKIVTKYGLFFVMVSIGLMFGAILANDIGMRLAESDGDLAYLGYLVIVWVSMYIGLYCHLTIHEAGHYYFGKQTGYTFVSLRIGKLMFIKENGRIVLKYFNIPGTSGQCLMLPPQPYREDFPYLLYNHGGWIFNLISAILISLILLLVPMHYLLRTALLIQAFIAFIFAATNGIPMKSNGFPNDGYNIQLLKKSADCRKAFWMQMQIHGVFMSGVRLRDMPPEWFQRSESADSTNPLIATMDSFRCSYELDHGETEQATLLALELIDRPGLLEFQKHELRCVILFSEIMAECRSGIINSLYTKPLQKFIQKTSFNPARHRLNYALEKIYFRDEEKAKKAKKKFEKTLKTFPYRVVIKDEKNLMVRVDERAGFQKV